MEGGWNSDPAKIQIQITLCFILMGMMLKTKTNKQRQNKKQANKQKNESHTKQSLIFSLTYMVMSGWDLSFHFHPYSTPSLIVPS